MARDRLHYGPCEKCGEQNFRQMVEQTEDVRTDGDAGVEAFDVKDYNPVELWCKTCDEMIWESEEPRGWGVAE